MVLRTVDGVGVCFAVRGVILFLCWGVREQSGYATRVKVNAIFGHTGGLCVKYYTASHPPKHAVPIQTYRVTCRIFYFHADIFRIIIMVGARTYVHGRMDNDQTLRVLREVFKELGQTR